MEHSPAAPPEEPISRPSSRLSAHYPRDTRRCRVILIFLSICIAIGIIIGTIFVAHSYYHSWGGQGFLRTRAQFPYRDTPVSHLPLRQMIVAAKNTRVLKRARVQKSRSILPFYICGDQQNSCEAYSRPNICCPVGMACHPTVYSTSGSYCCTLSGSGSECEASLVRPPQCPNTTHECAADFGGGCCPQDSTCSQNGCIEFFEDGSPPQSTSTITTTLTYTTASKVVTPSTDTPIESSGIFVTTTTTTMTMVIGGATTLTAIVPKQGEQAQKAQGVSAPKPGWPGPQIPCSPLLMVVAVALTMGLL